jgi:hypothetical protein
MARFSVVLTDSFLEALDAMPEWARDETAEVIQALESGGDFDPDPAEYIIDEISRRVAANPFATGAGN